MWIKVAHICKYFLRMNSWEHDNWVKDMQSPEALLEFARQLSREAVSTHLPSSK